MLLLKVSIQVVFPASGKSSFRELYPVWVSATKSTYLWKFYHMLLKIEPNTALKVLSCKASTHLNEKYRVWAICRDASIRLLDAFLMQFSTVLVGLQVEIRLKTSEKSQSFEGGNNLFQDRAIGVLERDIFGLQGKKFNPSIFQELKKAAD